jgi:hypothetical protein
MPKRNVTNVIINKISRSTPLVDVPISFPPQGELMLGKLEIEKKVKKGAPMPKKQPIIYRPPSRPAAVSAPASPSTNRPDHTPSRPATNGENAGDKSARSTRKRDRKDTRPDGSDAGAEKDATRTTQNSSNSSPPSNNITQTVQANQGAPSPPPLVADDPEEEIQEEPEEEMSPEEKERREVEEYVWRFRLLKKKYPKADIPEYSEHSDLLTMKVNYDRVAKELYMDDCTSSYKRYLLMAFVGVEWGAKWVGVDIAGFAKSEREAMQDYDKYLIEMGEKSYSMWGQNLPVEIRLLLFMLFKVVTFFVIKNMFGSNFETKKARPKMRGPSIRPDQRFSEYRSGTKSAGGKAQQSRSGESGAGEGRSRDAGASKEDGQGKDSTNHRDGRDGRDVSASKFTAHRRSNAPGGGKLVSQDKRSSHYDD